MFALWLVALGCLLASRTPLGAQEPVNPHASQKTRDVLKLLYDLPNRAEHRVMSGQVIRPLDESPRGTSRPYREIDDRVQMLYDRFGTWVGIVGAEYSDWGTAWGTQHQRILSAELNPSLIAHSHKGGIVALHFHPLSPRNGQDKDTVTADDVLKPGPIHDHWMRLLYDAAAGLRELRDNDVVVLWRPMHGSDLGWWWGGASMSNADYRRIWAHMVDYFSNVWGLDNILYVQSWYGGGIYADITQLYAGDSNVDVVGIDHNATFAQPGEYESMLSFKKVFGISESWVFTDDPSAQGTFDMRRVIEDIRRLWPRCAFFVQFDHPRYPNNHIGANLFSGELLADPWILNAPILGAERKLPFDTTPPLVTVSASPATLWPPNGKMVPVTVSGKITDAVSGVTMSTATYAVTDEYKQVQPQGSVTLKSDGSFSFTIHLRASRDGNDKDGRHYTITVSAHDHADNKGSMSTGVIVPYDQGK